MVNADNSETFESPSVVIYQQPDHVSGLLQQLYERPLVSTETMEASLDGETKSQGLGSTSAKANLSGQVPGFGKAGFELGGTVGGGLDSRTLESTRNTYEFVYSQAYYLHLVRKELLRCKLVRKIGRVQDAENLGPGSFVEFSASFRVEQSAAVLDVLNPNLVAAIYRAVRMKNWSKSDGFASYDELQQNAAKFDKALELETELVRGIAEAVRVDFRSDKTREFYGDISDGLTAITICDEDNFTVADEDRILDGTFTVLGKVTEGVLNDRPVFSRNKLLDIVNPESIDSAFEEFNRVMQAGGESIEQKMSQDSNLSPIDLSLSSRVDGASFKVIPIAVFA